MPLNVVVNIGARPRPQIVIPSVVVQHARASGNPNAAKALAVTRPFITIDQTGLHYDTRKRSGRMEFRFRSGSLRLTLRQSIRIANDLSPCAQSIWAQHEQDHVRDNQRLMRKISPEIRSHRNLRTIFFAPRWRPRDSFNAIQTRIRTTIGDIFMRMTVGAIQSRDTPAEYARVQRRILQTCPSPFYHKVERGESLSKLAVFYYGHYRFWQSIYEKNRPIIGRDPDLIHPGQQLLIPKNP
jgi:nucleoid-associated protein YgaU